MSSAEADRHIRLTRAGRAHPGRRFQGTQSPLGEREARQREAVVLGDAVVPLLFVAFWVPGGIPPHRRRTREGRGLVAEKVTVPAPESGSYARIAGGGNYESENSVNIL